MSSSGERLRRHAFGQAAPATSVDRLGVWLSARQIRRACPSFADKQVGDFGCGFDARFARTILPDVAGIVLVDVALAPDLKTHPKVTPIEGELTDALAGIPDRSLDVTLCISVLEHLWDPLEALCQFRRLLADDGLCLVNVPSWRGKRFLELSAFTLGLSPADEMDDHKMYYDPKDLWPLLVRAGFLPHQIRCFRHKLGLNTFAVCRAGPSQGIGVKDPG